MRCCRSIKHLLLVVLSAVVIVSIVPSLAATGIVPCYKVLEVICSEHSHRDVSLFYNKVTTLYCNLVVREFVVVHMLEQLSVPVTKSSVEIVGKLLCAVLGVKLLYDVCIFKHLYKVCNRSVFVCLNPVGKPFLLKFSDVLSIYVHTYRSCKLLGNFRKIYL